MLNQVRQPTLHSWDDSTPKWQTSCFRCKNTSPGLLWNGLLLLYPSSTAQDDSTPSWCPTHGSYSAPFLPSLSCLAAILEPLMVRQVLQEENREGASTHLSSSSHPGVWRSPCLLQPEGPQYWPLPPSFFCSKTSQHTSTPFSSPSCLGAHMLLISKLPSSLSLRLEHNVRSPKREKLLSLLQLWQGEAPLVKNSEYISLENHRHW